MKFADRLKIEPSATVTINSIALQKKQQGIRVYNLAAGECIIDSPEIVKEAALKAIREDKIKYPPVAGLAELRQAASSWLNELYSTSYSPKETIVTAGGKYGIYSSCEAMINEGDEAIIIAPFWVSYSEIVKLFGGIPKIIQTKEENHWKVNLDELKNNITDKTKILIINNASNPTGTLYSKKEIEDVLKLAQEKGITIISDEVYSGLVYEGEFISFGSFKEYKDNVIVIQSTSKNFAMTGWRIGFLFANEEIIKNITLLQSQTTSGAPTPGQWTALAAIQNYKEVMPNINKEMKKRRDLFYDTFNKLFNTNITKAESALYAFIGLPHLTSLSADSATFCKQLLEEANVASVPGIAFGVEGYVRFSFGEKEDELQQALQQLYKYIHS